MPQLPGANVLSWAAPAWREDGSCVMASGEEVVGGRRGVFLCQPENSLGLV